MNEPSSSNAAKKANQPPDKPPNPEETRKIEKQYTKSQKDHSGMYPNQNQNQAEEDEKVPDTEVKKENILHGPNAGMFIKNQKISKKESLNQHKYYFQRGITKEQEEAEIKMEKERIYNNPEFCVIKCKNQDVITASGDITPPWGSEIVTDPEFPDIVL